MNKISLLIERKLIKFHLMRVERKLLHANPCLTKSLQIRRQHNLDILHEYITREEFPKNTDYPDKRLPHFKDKQGTPCAVAYLIEKSGNTKLVEVIASQNNLVYINDVKDGPLIDWLARSGLTQREAAEIQPAYCGSGCQLMNEYGFILFLLVWSAITFGLGSIAYKKIKSSKDTKKSKIIFLSIAAVVSAFVGFIGAGFFSLLIDW